MISESAATQFSLTICESKGAVGADKSMRHIDDFGDGSVSVFINSF
jgi:hypothetical protein